MGNFGKKNYIAKIDPEDNDGSQSVCFKLYCNGRYDIWKIILKIINGSQLYPDIEI